MGCRAYKAASCNEKETACRKTFSLQRAMTNAGKPSHPMFWDTGMGAKGKCHLALEKKDSGRWG